MTCIEEEIEKLMNLANNKKLVLECIRMEIEDEISKVRFYLDSKKINYEDLVKILN